MPEQSQFDPIYAPDFFKRKPVSYEPTVESEFPDTQGRSYDHDIDALTLRVEKLETLIKSIFDGHVLINGKFVKITP